MDERKYKITVAFKNVNLDPESWGRVGYSFSQGFLVIDSEFDTFYLSLDEIREIRIVERDYSLSLLHGADEYLEELKQIDAKNDRILNLVREATASINGLKKYAEFCIGPTPEELVQLNDMLAPERFKVVLAAEGRYRIKVLPEQQ